MASLTTEAAAASSSSSSLPLSSTDHQNHYTYEVFLSFRGDTRFNFTDHLYNALCQRGIETFRDANKLRIGEEISPALLKAIEESRVSIVVFSQNYASSKWCLEELVKILECKSKGQKVKPVFYKVDPSDVRHQKGDFGDAFAKLERRHNDSMRKWKAALKEAANLSGWQINDGEYEAKFIDDIVKELSTQVIIPSYDLDVAEHPIGLESCRQDVNRLLKAEEDDLNRLLKAEENPLKAKKDIVRMVAIWGTGGIGKSTIAKAVFNSIRHKFEGSCFLANVRSISSSTPNGLAELQEKLLVNILRDPNLKVSSADQGVSIIKARMREKKVLLVLDDVSHSKQLKNLVPSLDCFGSGSRILITTRDKGWLTAHRVGADELYEVKMLDDDQALELFSLHAFQRNEPIYGYLELAQRVVHYAKGLPLALIVLGSHLCGGSRDEWEATLDSCKGEDPHREIRNILKISYDALGVELQGYFLDMACFFNGMLVQSVKPILEACYDLNSEIGIKKLQEKALIQIHHETRNGGWIWMHDLIEEMGKHIVYQESPNELGQRSRVWTEDDVNNILTNNTGTNKVIGIQVWSRSSPISLNAKSFSRMKNLRYISITGMIKHECFSGDIDYLSNQLRWLDWSECPLQSFPSDFHANKLVKLNIPCSRGITRLWEGRKNFSRLTYVNLSGCASLKELPDLSAIPNLKELDLSGCRSLVEVPNSVGFLQNLFTLKIDHCSNLIKFPRIFNWKYVETISIRSCKLEEFSEVGKDMGSLRILDLSGTCIKELDESIGNLFSEVGKEMGSLRILDLSDTCIKELDESIGNLIGLEELKLLDCQNLTTLPCSIYGLQNLKRFELTNSSKLVRFPTNTKILNVDGCSLSLPKLQELSISGCSLSDCDFLMTLDCWETLYHLDLSRNNFVSLPHGFTKFVKLFRLDLVDCKRLREIPELPRKKGYLDISGCELLLRFSKLIEAESSLCSETPKRHCTAEELSTEPTPVIPPK